MIVPIASQGFVGPQESGTYTAPAGVTSFNVAGVTLQEMGTSTVFAGDLSLVVRDCRITYGFAAFSGRPQEGGTHLGADGLQWQIVGVVKRALGSFWEITARTFAVPGGLYQRCTLSARSSSRTPKGLPNPAFTVLESSVPCLLMEEAFAPERGESPVDTVQRARAVIQGYRTITAGMRFQLADAPAAVWDVDGADPFDASLGCQTLTLSRRL